MQDHSTPDNPLAVKRCSKCGEVKALDAFYRSGADGRLQSQCKDCQRSSARIRRYNAYHADPIADQARQRVYRESHRVQIKVQRRTYYELHRGEILARVTAWAAGNPDRVRARVNAWQKSHPSLRAQHGKRYRLSHLIQIAGYRQSRRARQRQAFREHVSPIAVFNRDNWCCGICGKQVRTNEASLDHIIPLSKGGVHSYQNVQCAHRQCNSAKGARGPGQTRLFGEV